MIIPAINLWSLKDSYNVFVDVRTIQSKLIDINIAHLYGNVWVEIIVACNNVNGTSLVHLSDLI